MLQVSCPRGVGVKEFRNTSTGDLPQSHEVWVRFQTRSRLHTPSPSEVNGACRHLILFLESSVVDKVCTD